MEDVRSHRDIKFVTTEGRRNYLVSEPIYHTTNFFKKFISNRNRKTQMLVNKQVYEFWYDNVKPKYGEKVLLWYMDTRSFLVYIKTEDIYVHIAKDVETTTMVSCSRFIWITNSSDNRRFELWISCIPGRSH